MQTIERLAKSIDERKLDRAKRGSVEENLLDGPRLFRFACEAVKTGLRIDFPEASEEKIHELLIERVYRRS